MIDHMNRTMQKHIVTIEDPIEFLHRDRNCIINQREVGQDTASFKRALRRVLRQDPDVILVGEMRDEETVHTALSAAETGHLVLSTLHTVDAPETVNRIIDFFPPHQQQQARAMIAGTLKGIVSQRLVRTADGHGRVACCEILVMTGRVHDMILDPKLTGQLPEVVAEGGYYGMQTFDQHLLKHLQRRPDHVRRGDARRDLAARLQADGRRRAARSPSARRAREPRLPQMQATVAPGRRPRPAAAVGAAARRAVLRRLTRLAPGAQVARLAPHADHARAVQRDAIAGRLRASELEAPEGPPRGGHDPGQARVDGRLPGRRDVRARRLGRSRAACSRRR